MATQKENHAPNEPEEPTKFPTIGERLRYEREIHNWTQDELAEKLGTTAVSVSRWENNTHLPEIAYRKKLCELFKKSSLELGFVKEPGEESEADLVDGHASRAPNSNERLPRWHASISAESYYALPQRELELQNLQEELQNRQGSSIVVIDGLGGLGKTSIALEAARRLLSQGQYEYVVGDSAKLQLLADEEIISVREATLDFDTLLNTIARQIGYWELLTFPPDKKRSALAQLFKQQQYLVLVDNLETAENAQTLIAQLHELLNGSRAIVTSRNKVHHSFVYPLTIQKLDWKNSLIFMRMEQKKQKGKNPSKLTEADLYEIYTITGGAPLALKLVLSQSLTLNLDIVLRRLKKAGTNLYSYIFRQSWEHLSTTAQHLLIYVGRTVVDTVGWEELLDAEIAVNEEVLVTALSQLVNASLLDVSTASSQKRHYYSMHQLTRQFVCSELPDSW